MSLKILAKKLLPDLWYQRLGASEIAKRIVRGTMWSLLGTAISRLLILLCMIFLARILGQTAFGEFGMIQSTLGVAGLMAGFGLGSTATRFIAQHSKTDPDRAGRIIALVFQSSWTLIVITGVIIVAASGPIARVALSAPHLETALICGTLLMVTMAIRGVQTGMLAGFERFDVIAKLNVLEGIVSLLGLVFLAVFLGVKGGLLGLTFGSTVTWFVGQFALKRNLNQRGIPISHRSSWQERRILTGYSLPSFLAGSVATPILWYCMTLVANRPDGYDDLALYQAAYQWHGPLIFLPMTLVTVSTPVLVQEWENGTLARFRRIFLFNVVFIGVASLLPVLALAIISPWMMGIYGHGFREGWLVLVMLISAAPMHAISKIASSALLGMNRAWCLMWVNLFWAACLLAVALWLVPNAGSKGLSTAFLIAYSAMAIVSVAIVLFISRSGK